MRERKNVFFSSLYITFFHFFLLLPSESYILPFLPSSFREREEKEREAYIVSIFLHFLLFSFQQLQVFPSREKGERAGESISPEDI